MKKRANKQQVFNDLSCFVFSNSMILLGYQMKHNQILSTTKKPPNTNDEGTDVISVCILILKPIRVSRNFFLSSFFFSRKIFVCHVFQRHDVQLYSVFYISQVNLLGNINTSVWKMYALFTAANLLSVSVWYTKDKSNLFFLFN